MLDTMDLERERGITIKARPSTVITSRGDGRYDLNFIDTPGHVDFSYEVSRALAACEGALLVVDSTQGVEAQTVANAYLAVENDLELIPVVNKIDLPAADPEGVSMEIEQVLGLPAEDAIYAQRQIGQGNPGTPRQDLRETSGSRALRGRQAPGSDLRQSLRRLSRRGRLRPRLRRFHFRR